jgi:hypothetical protein
MPANSAQSFSEGIVGGYLKAMELDLARKDQERQARYTDSLVSLASANADEASARADYIRSGAKKDVVLSPTVMQHYQDIAYNSLMMNANPQTLKTGGEELRAGGSGFRGFLADAFTRNVPGVGDTEVDTAFQQYSDAVGWNAMTPNQRVQAASVFYSTLHDKSSFKIPVPYIGTKYKGGQLRDPNAQAQ